MKLTDITDIAVSGLVAQRARMSATASNVANAHTTRTASGEAYRRRDPVFRKYAQFRRETSDELFHRVNQCIRAKRKDIAVCTYTAAGVDVIRRESNSALGRPLPR